MDVLTHRDTVLINRFSRLLGERRQSVTDVARATGLSRATLTDLYYARTTRVELATLDKLCGFFRVGPEQIFEWTPDDRPSAPGSDGDGDGD